MMLGWHTKKRKKHNQVNSRHENSKEKCIRYQRVEQAVAGWLVVRKAKQTNQRQQQQQPNMK